MRKFTLLLVLVGLFAAATTVAQTPGVKGNGEVFYTQTFGWGNPADPKGWTAPEGFYFLDPLDLGYNWVWWPGDLGYVSKWTQDPPLNSTTKADGVIANFVEKYNMDANEAEINLDNSIGFPPIDCSQHGSVIVRYQTHFMAYSVAHMWLEISVDNWVHSAMVNVNFGCGHKDRPLDKPKGEPALFEANISDVVAGMSDVRMRLHWLDTRLYYWAVDDFTLSEAYNYDMKLKYIQMEWDDLDENTRMSWIYNIPKTQLDGNVGFNNFESATLNFGEYDQEEVYLDLNITKGGGTNVFNKTTAPKDVAILITDTAKIPDKYIPVDFGHYKVNWEFKGKFAENNPVDNSQESFFNVTDSIYSRSDDSNELGWSMTKESYTTAATANINHFAGGIFPIFGDCEVSSISVFITGGKADNLLLYKFSLWKKFVNEGEETTEEVLVTEQIPLDSADFNTWVTMELSKDGETEFLKKGDLVYAGISQDNLNEDYLIRRNQGLEIGTDKSVQLTESTGVGIFDGGINTGLGSFYGKKNYMIRLNLNDHRNRIDGVENNLTTAVLGQNYPNPFNGATQIDYELVNGSEVIFEVMDMTGRKVLTQNEGFVPAGKHQLTLNAGSLDAGIYFYTIKAGSFVETKQMVVN
jgi:hypothetical protein